MKKMASKIQAEKGSGGGRLPAILAAIVLGLGVVTLTACGGGSLTMGEIMEGEPTTPGAAQTTVREGINAGSQFSTSSHYTFQHKMDAAPTDGLMRSRHYDLRSAD